MKKYKRHINPRYFLTETTELYEDNQPFKTVDEVIAAIEAGRSAIKPTSEGGELYNKHIDEWIINRAGAWGNNLSLIKQEISKVIATWNKQTSKTPDMQAYQNLLEGIEKRIVISNV